MPPIPHGSAQSSFRSLRLSAFLLLGASLAVGCQREPKPEEPAANAISAAEQALAVRAQQSYADLAHAIYGDATESASSLLAELDRFLAAPSAEGLERARVAWIAARPSYQQSEVFRFCDGPIDRFETRINTWPIDESFVELGSAAGKPGIVEDFRTYPEISAALLGQLNLGEGETSVTTGYHVVEYLLWGRDTHADGPGDRSFEDYVRIDGKEKRGAPAVSLAARRASYLRAATELLRQELGEVRDAWAPGIAGNYRAKFLDLPSTTALGLMIKGMGSLSGPELSGERLTVPYETKDQENEHSCFSDTTELDISNDALGVENVCLGRYRRRSGELFRGTGVCDVIALRDPTLASRLKRELAASVEAARHIPAPFDQAILGDDAAPGRQAIRATISALQRQTESLAQVAALFDLRVSLAQPRARQ